MTAEVHAALATSGCHINSSNHCGYPSPSVDDFKFKAIFSIGGFHFTKPMLLALICAGLVVWFFWAAFAKPKIVPRGVQNLAEVGVFFVRDQIGRSMIGRKTDQFLPFLVSIFFFVWIMNVMEIIPVAQFPVTSKIAFPAAIMLMVYGTYMYLGMKHQGPIKFFTNAMFPPGVPLVALCILAPVELLQLVLVRPFTLAVRLFANMFAGHLLLLTFTLASWYLFSASIDVLFSATSFVLVIVLTAFEMLIQGLQAFIFTTLTAQYIGGALEEGAH
jgi:F-type H+-transporting ATPase subunit a